MLVLDMLMSAPDKEENVCGLAPVWLLGCAAYEKKLKYIKQNIDRNIQWSPMPIHLNCFWLSSCGLVPNERTAAANS